MVHDRTHIKTQPCPPMKKKKKRKEKRKKKNHHTIENMKSSSPLFLALLFLLITTSLVEAIHAKRACNGTVAECDKGEEEWQMESDTVRRLLQSGPTQTYKALNKGQPACATSSGGAYSNNCYKPVNSGAVRRVCMNSLYRC
ncbi:Rapid alkalinization factor [Acorus calamus]|uniref:Rapid alkalinization factor n=1 Tax=Acorus calamus TaxID=4465 RepID=A0AAV9D1F3_ACOCL|nr:Rapid alkalinization factor [Acorus calamus]